MHHRSFHYRDSDIILNNNITVMLLRVISQTIVAINNYPAFKYFHKPNKEPTGSKHVTVLHKNVFYNKTSCVRTRGSPRKHSWCPRAV